MSELITMRIECEDVSDIGSNDLREIVRAAILLGNNQVDLAVEPKGISQVSSVFTDLTFCRLLRKDPLFSPEKALHSQYNNTISRGNGKTYAHDAYSALRHIRARYVSAQKQPDMPSDPRILDWFATELKRIEELMRHFGKQMLLLVLDRQKLSRS
ncbi:hypothetical protein N7494_005415 [Penicillium frequentans]|uniref:Uncharacterized protein n=1 Tax=Penicillium frequentans TaxID=3151616 RepID=A0AAD6D0J7_9EURO|nr:hypothetical protein N7494_005394 [Penicillium glabrum]KAJ5544136.1 hypothetical protein N7494_005415 [Penicillium glabrum]